MTRKKTLKNKKNKRKSGKRNKRKMIGGNGNIMNKIYNFFKISKTDQEYFSDIFLDYINLISTLNWKINREYKYITPNNSKDLKNCQLLDDQKCAENVKCVLYKRNECLPLENVKLFSEGSEIFTGKKYNIVNIYNFEFKRKNGDLIIININIFNNDNKYIVLFPYSLSGLKIEELSIILSSIEEKLIPELNNIMKKNNKQHDFRIFLTGHSSACGLIMLTSIYLENTDFIRIIMSSPIIFYTNDICQNFKKKYHSKFISFNFSLTENDETTKYYFAFKKIKNIAKFEDLKKKDLLQILEIDIKKDGQKLSIINSEPEEFYLKFDDKTFADNIKIINNFENISKIDILENSTKVHEFIYVKEYIKLLLQKY